MPVEERVRMLRALGAAGADLNRSGPWATPLYSAALNGDDEAIEALLTAGADPHWRPTGLQGACFAASGPNPSMERVVDLLVAAGLDPNDVDEAGSPLSTPRSLLTSTGPTTPRATASTNRLPLRSSATGRTSSSGWPLRGTEHCMPLPRPAPPPSLPHFSQPGPTRGTARRRARPRWT